MEKEILFENAWHQNLKHPTTFLIPDKQDIHNLKKGDFVKICAFAERFWVKLTFIDNGDPSDYRYRGIIDNDLITEYLHLGEEVEFHERNIYSIDTDNWPQKRFPSIPNPDFNKK